MFMTFPFGRSNTSFMQKKVATSAFWEHGIAERTAYQHTTSDLLTCNYSRRCTAEDLWRFKRLGEDDVYLSLEKKGAKAFILILLFC